MTLARTGAGALLRAASRRHVGAQTWSRSREQSAPFASTSRAGAEEGKDVGNGEETSHVEENDATTSATQQITSLFSTMMSSTSSQEEANSASPTASMAKTKTAKNGKGKSASLRFDLQSFPSLLHQPHPILDAYQRFHSPATEETPFETSVTFFNSPRYPQPFSATADSSAGRIVASGESGGGDDIDSGAYLESITPLSAREVNDLHRHLLKIRRVVQQTGKGRSARMSALVVAGNGRGMVGYGEGKDINASAATRKAFHAAVKSMDFVERHNGQTIPSEVTGKWSATTVTLRPRPPGFGLRVPPVVHAIARSAGITDMSASIIGSTNPINVAKATLSLLWSGSAPQALGDGVGGSIRRADKGRGARTVRDIELMRGRRLREVSANGKS